MTVFYQIWKTIRARLLVISGILGVLMFISTLFVLGVHHAQDLSAQVQEKLGIYVYLDDTPEMEAVVTAEALQLVKDLESIDIQSQYYTKEDAFNILKDKLPDVTADLEKYGIDNPLPPTMYIIFEDEKQWTEVKNVVLRYENIIQNAQDIDTHGFSFSEQERRVVDILNILSIARV